MIDLPQQDDHVDTGPILRWSVGLGAALMALLLLAGSYLAYQNHLASRPPLITSTPSTIGQTNP